MIFFQFKVHCPESSQGSVVHVPLIRIRDGVQQKCDEQELEDQRGPQEIDLQLAEIPGNPQSLEARWRQASLAAQCVHA